MPVADDAMFKTERRLRNRETAERHLELAAMFGHKIAGKMCRLTKVDVII
jgi:hypothetical protein